MYPTTTGTGGADIAPADGRSIYSRADSVNSGGYAAAAYWGPAPQPMHHNKGNKRMAVAAYPMAPSGPYALPPGGMRYGMGAHASYAYGPPPTAPSRRHVGPPPAPSYRQAGAPDALEGHKKKCVARSKCG